MEIRMHAGPGRGLGKIGKEVRENAGMNYLWLAGAILSEVIATSSLKASAGFTRPLPSVVVVVGYGAAFYFLSQTLKTIPVGVAYAIWSGLGTVLIALVGLVLYKQTLDRAAMLGMALIIAGVLVMNLFSKSAAH
jgi:small multidrug resistance pump